MSLHPTLDTDIADTYQDIDRTSYEEVIFKMERLDRTYFSLNYMSWVKVKCCLSWYKTRKLKCFYIIISVFYINTWIIFRAWHYTSLYLVQVWAWPVQLLLWTISCSWVWASPMMSIMMLMILMMKPGSDNIEYQREPCLRRPAEFSGQNYWLLEKVWWLIPVVSLMRWVSSSHSSQVVCLLLSYQSWDSLVMMMMLVMMMIMMMIVVMVTAIRFIQLNMKSHCCSTHYWHWTHFSVLVSNKTKYKVNSLSYTLARVFKKKI